MDWQSFKSGDLVWFDPNNSGFHIPGEIQEVHVAAQVLIVGAFIDGKVSITHILLSCVVVVVVTLGTMENLFTVTIVTLLILKRIIFLVPLSLFSFSTHLFGFLKN